MPSSAKAAVDALVDRGRAGYERRAEGHTITVETPAGPERVFQPGEVLESVSPARARAALLREHRRHLAELARDPEAWPSEEAEAGGILEAETAVEIHQMAGDLRAWVDAHRKG